MERKDSSDLLSHTKLVNPEMFTIKTALNNSCQCFVSGIGIGYLQPEKQTFIVHNGEVYICATAIKDATIKHS